MLLLDTHTFLWYLNADLRLPDSTRERIQTSEKVYQYRFLLGDGNKVQSRETRTPVPHHENHGRLRFVGF